MNHLELIAFIGVLLLLSVGIILFVVVHQRRVLRHQAEMNSLQIQKKMELMQASIESEEVVRLHIAGELHDDVGATLSSIRLFLTQAAQTSNDPKLIGYSKSLLDDAILKVRNLSHQLQPRTLQYLGLLKSLQSLAEMLSSSGLIAVSYSQTDDILLWPEPDTSVALAVYRITQELIQNLIKHGDAHHIQLQACFEGASPCVEIRHDGKGLLEEGYRTLLYKKGTIGLKNIETRLKAAGLFLSFPAANAPPAFVKICLPVPA